MNRESLKLEIKKMVAEELKKLKEVSATGGVAGFNSKFAFGKVKDRVARQAGMTPVASIDEKKAKKAEPKPVVKKAAVQPPKPTPVTYQDVQSFKKDKALAKSRKDDKTVNKIDKVQQLIKRVQPWTRVDEEVDYDVKKDYDTFVQKKELADYRLDKEVTSKFKKNFVGKKIVARASKGYKQFKKDYTIDVSDVKIEDYYNNLEIVFVGRDGKEYFIDRAYKVKIMDGAAAPAEPKQPEQPAQTEKPAAPQQTATPETELGKEIEK